jgi:hypothetical protein
MQVTFLSIDQRDVHLLKRLKKWETFGKTLQGVSVDTGLKSSGLLARSPWRKNAFTGFLTGQTLTDGIKTLPKRLDQID